MEQANIGFGEALEKGVQNGVSYLMVYGREDPWVVPLWGQRAYLRLRMAEQQQQQQHGDLQRVSYCELTPAGHCPHHEAPRTVGKVTEGWIRSMEREGREEEEQGGQHVTAGQVSTSTEIEKEQQQQQQKDDGQRSFPPLHREHGLMKERVRCHPSHAFVRWDCVYPVGGVVCTPLPMQLMKLLHLNHALKLHFPVLFHRMEGKSGSSRSATGFHLGT